MLFRKIVVLLLAVVAAPKVMADEFPAIVNSPGEDALTPMDAQQVARTASLPAGFQLTVFAAEPDIQNPIAMTWDQRGRLWVAENFTYSDRTQRFDLSLQDRVLILEDRDGDGQAESRRVFTDRVQMLTSVEVGRGGVWLMCPPQLLFIPDRDEDGVADGPAQVMLDGFVVARDNYHNFANGLSWGPDGWLYGRCGHSCPAWIGVPGATDQQRVPIDGGIWRFHPQRRIVEVLCHGTVNPWGHDWDRNGELFFINTVIGHVWHVMPGAHFKESFGESMNPAVYQRMDTIADHYHFDTRGELDGRDGTADHLGGGHAHIGMMIYQADAWPEAYRDKLFTVNMHGRRVNVERLERQGAGYVARHEPDFLLVDDPFFRGIDLNTGPDGNVYLIDWSDTGECHEHTGVHRTSGRIYKIGYQSNRDVARRFTARPVPKPYCVAGEGALPDLWRRHQAGETSSEELRGLLRDSDPHMRAWAIRLLTEFWPLDTILGPRAAAEYPDDAATHAELVRLAKEDASSLVQLVLASTLQRLPVAERAELAAAMMQHSHYAQDRDLPLLVWYGVMPLATHHPQGLIELATVCRWPLTQRMIARRIASEAQVRPDVLDQLLRSGLTLPVEFQQAMLLGMHDAFQGWQSLEPPDSWSAFRQSSAAAQLPDVVRRLDQLFGDGVAPDELRRIVRDSQLDLQTRSVALQSLIDARSDDLRDLCLSLLGTRVLNATAIRGLALDDSAETARAIARRYRNFHPDDRPSVLELLVSRVSFANVLLEQLNDPRSPIPADALTPFHARQIRGLGDSGLNEKLRSVWGELRDSPLGRRTLIERLKSQLSDPHLAEPDLGQGRQLFNKTCAQCHRLYGVGQQVGPDLTGSQRANLDYLLENIVDPSAVVGKDYRMSIVITTDGRVLNGLIVSQDKNTLVLQTPVEQVTLALSSIDELKVTDQSSMPDGLLDQLTDEQIRDLIGYLRHPVQVPLP